MKARPPIGTRVEISRSAGLSNTVHRKTGVVVAHHVDGIALVVRLDPQSPPRPYMPPFVRRFDKGTRLTFRRREGDWGVDYHDVRELPVKKKAHAEPKGRTLRRRRPSSEAK